MRKAIQHLIILLMLMPSLVCAMPLCDIGKTVDENTKPHCAELQESEQSDTSVTSTVMLFTDCGQVDLAIYPYQNLDVDFLDLDYEDWEYDQVDTLPSHFLKKPSIRGSPPAACQPNSLPIYLATQRLRI